MIMEGLDGLISISYTLTDTVRESILDRMTRRSLSKREADLVLALEWDKQRLLTIKDIAKRLRCSPNYAYRLAHTLQRKGWLETIVPGTFLLVGAERGPKGVPEGNPFVVARVLPKPYFFAYRWACVHHGLGTQVPSVVHVALARRKRPIEIKHMRFEFVALSPKRIFGYEETTQFGEKINVTDMERTILDAIDRPELVGGIEAAAQAVFFGAKKMDHNKILDYLKRFNDAALARRFGYLCDVLKVILPKALNECLASHAKRLPAYLGTPARWGRGGQIDERWGLIINVPQDELMGEVRIG